MSTTTPQKYRKVDYRNNNYNIDVYSYNPFTNQLPSTTEHWKYIKYKPKNDGIQTTFDFVKPTDAVDDNIWVLYGGSGGYGGSSKKKAGGGGGGGSGELKLSLLDKTKFTNINCTIGILNPQYSIDYGGSRNYNYNTTSATTLEIKNKTTTTDTTTDPPTDTTTDTLIDTLKATGGFCGDYMSKGRTGGVGGHGANVIKYNGSNLVLNNTTETYDTATATTIPFGSMGGGGGYGNGDRNAEMGDRYELFPKTNSTTIFEYKYVADTTVRKYTDGVHSGVNIDFTISLTGVPCDGTGTVRILKPGDAGSAAAYGSPSEGGFIMFFYKTTPSSLQQYSQSFPPSMNIYNYNPFTNLAPYPDNWVYYKYNSIDIETQFNFKHTIQNIPDGEPVWILYAGCGGNNGGYNAGCGGGGGPGETVLSVIPRTNTTTDTATGNVTTTYNTTTTNTATGNVTTTATTTIKTSADATATVISTTTSSTENLVLNCKIGSINYNGEASNANSKTTITYGSTTLTANEGFCGATTGNNTGANGGTGGGLARDVTTTQNTSTDTTFRFGSGGGGGGGSIHGRPNGEYGNRTVCSLQSGSTTVYDYKYVVNNGRGRDGYGCAVDFNKTLKENYCDGTGYILDADGNASFLKGGSGGESPGNNQSVNGENGPAGFIMIFHKTTRPLTKNYYPPTGASFGRNPKTGFMPSYTNFINEKAYFFVNSGNSASVSAADFNTMFKLTGTNDTNPKYLAVGGGGGGGSPWWCEYDSFGGGGGGGGQPKYGTIGRQTDGTLSFIVGGDGGTGGKRGFTVVGNSGGNGGDTTLTFGTTSITAAGGGGGQNAADRRDSIRMALAGYGGGMGGRNNVTVQSSTTGPSGGFGSKPIRGYTSGGSYYDASASEDLADFDGGDALRLIRNFNDDWFTWYQEINGGGGFSYVAHTTYGPDPAPWWRNGYDLNLSVSTDYFSQGSFRVTYGGDAGNDGLSGIRTGRIDWERPAYSGSGGGSGYILLWGKGPSGQV